MAIVSTDSRNYENIAEAIREESGSKLKYIPSEMPAAIRKIKSTWLNDSVISEDTVWSSFNVIKQTADRFASPFSQKTAVVQGELVQDYPMSVKSYIEPIQEGTGDPSPENVRPIKGVTSLTLTVSGSVVATTAQDAPNGPTYTADFGQTVYGGSYQWDTGELTIDRRKITFDGTEKEWFAQRGGANLYRMTYSSGALKDWLLGPDDINSKVPGSICTSYSQVTPAETWQARAVGFNIEKGNAFTISIYDENFKNTADIDVWKRHLADLAEQGKPLQFVLMATPEHSQSIQLSKHRILAQDGITTVYSDHGETEVTARKDPSAERREIEKRLSALEAAHTPTL